MADTVSFYFFSRGVKRSVHRPVKNREERITLENGLNGAQRLNPSIGLRAGCLERLEQAQAKIVLSFMKDSRATISSIDHMINKTSLLPTRDSRHQQRLSHRCM